jgi:hypothetical protein
VRASILRREFDIYGGTQRWFELFQKSEAEAPLGRFAMSEFARALLSHCFDYSEVARRRRRNFRILSEELNRFGLFRDLLPEVVPLGFPMRVQNRDHLQGVLFSHRIYPAIHWPIEGIVPAEFGASHRLSADVITLPCDQRYDSTDMRRMVQLVLEALES